MVKSIGVKTVCLKSGGSPFKLSMRPLSLENQLLLTLDYWREYRTYFHIGQSWGGVSGELARFRVVGENVNQILKVFRILSDLEIAADDLD